MSNTRYQLGWPKLDQSNRRHHALAGFLFCFGEELDSDIRMYINYTCCMSCGNYEATNDIKEDLDADSELEISAYIFFHQQEAVDIIEQLNSNSDTITIHWCWEFADEKEHSKSEYDDLYKKITQTLDKFKDSGVTYDTNTEGITKKIITHVNLK